MLFKNNLRNETISQETGSFVFFFAAGILPLLMFLLALSVDLTNYLRADQKMQELADDAALLAWKYLPYKDQALLAIDRFIAARNHQGINADIRIASARPGSEDFQDEFEVILEKNFQPSFFSFLNHESTLKIKSVARARNSPVDVMIALDRSFYVAPSVISKPWVNSNISNYLRTSVPFQPFTDPSSGIRFQTPPAEFMTQLCFNPYFSNLKRTAISLYEYFSAFGRNGVGVGVFPGVGLENFRSIRGVLRPAQNVNTNVFDSGEAVALQRSFHSNEQDYYVQNGIKLGASSWCAGAAANEDAFSAETQSSKSNVNKFEKLERIWKPPFGYRRDSDQIVARDGDEIIFNSEYQPVLSVKEALWSAVAKASSANSKAVLDALIANLSVGPDFEEQSGHGIRGGLTSVSTRTAIILAGNVPYFDGIRFKNENDSVAKALSDSFSILRELLQINTTLRFKVIYIVLADDLRPFSSDLSELEQRTNSLSDYFENEKKIGDFGGRLDLQVIYSNNFENLNERVLSTLILDNSVKVLSY